MYVCIHVSYIYVCLCVRMSGYLYVCMYACTYVCIHTFTYIHIPVRMYVRIILLSATACEHVKPVCVCVCVCVFVYNIACTYIHIPAPRARRVLTTLTRPSCDAIWSDVKPASFFFFIISHPRETIYVYTCIYVYI